MANVKLFDSIVKQPNESDFKFDMPCIVCGCVLYECICIFYSAYAYEKCACVFDICSFFPFWYKVRATHTVRLYG